MLNLSLPDYTSNLHVMQNRLICQQDGGKNCFKQSFFYSWYRIGVTESLTLNDFLPLACVVNNSSQREHFGWSSRVGGRANGCYLSPRFKSSFTVTRFTTSSPPL